MNNEALRSLVEGYEKRLRDLIYIRDAIQVHGQGILDGWIGNLYKTIWDLKNIMDENQIEESCNKSEL